MSDLDKPTYLGRVDAVPFQKENCRNCDIRHSCKYRRFLSHLERLENFLNESWEKARNSYLPIKDNLAKHIARKQELYWPLLISAILMLLVFTSRFFYPQGIESPNNLPVESNTKIGFSQLKKNSQKDQFHANEQNVFPEEKIAGASDDNKNILTEEVAGIVKNTPMEAMVEPISQKPRAVAAFLVGIAMKESKFGIYSPKAGGRDCYNYWGYKGGGKTTAGGYTCFSSPEEAVHTVGARIEKLVDRGVKNPAQMISWKCGSSCAGHDPGGVKKWIADVGIYFYKINS